MRLQFRGPLPSSSEMKALDDAAILGGIPSEELMQRAGQAVTEYILSNHFVDLDAPVILCGPGNNGGDGLVVASLLKERGYAPQVIKLVEIDHTTVSVLSNASLIIDALLGTGAKGAPYGSLKLLLKQIADLKRRPAPILSIDIPTGVDSDTGQVCENCIKAHTTICIEFVKRGLLQAPAKSYVGKLVELEIGIATDLRSVKTKYKLLTSSSTPLRSDHLDSARIHKGSNGTVIVIGGSLDMPGAPVLSAFAALSIGSGISCVYTHKGWIKILTTPEVMFHHSSCIADYFTPDSLKDLIELLPKANSLVIGPGMGTNTQSSLFLSQLLGHTSEQSVPYVLDADGLNLLSQFPLEDLGTVGLQSAILTPHPGEAARLLGVSILEIQKDRFAASEEIFKKYQPAAVVLKGSGTIVYGHSGGWVDLEGGPELATAGSGDVLAGFIAGLLAQGVPALEAAKSGVFLHGRSGRYASREGKVSIVAIDIANSLKEVFPRTRI